MAVSIISKGKQSDPVIVKEQLEALQSLLAAWGPGGFMSYFMWVLAKNTNDEGMRHVPFRPNRIQDRLLDELGLQNLLLKARQMGGTTFMVLFRLLLRATTEPGFRGLLVSQSQVRASQHFLIVDRARRTFGMRMPGGGNEINSVAESLNKHLLKRKLANRRELLFENLDSSIFVESAQTKEAGQGNSANAFVGSEYSRWPGNPAETLANIRGSLAPGATQDLECTANGAQGSFYELVNLALNNDGVYKLHFFEWWWTDEYKMRMDEFREAMRSDPRLSQWTVNDLRADVERIDRAMLTEKEQRIKLEEITDTERSEYYARQIGQLTLEQIAWRRVQIKGGASTFRENFPEDAAGAFLAQGNSFFDNEMFLRRKQELAMFRPYKIGRNSEAILFWRPKANVEYIIGADVAEGVLANEAEGERPDTDYSSALVIEKQTGEIVAQYNARTRPDQYAVDLAMLGKMYNNAVIAVERNSYGTATILFLETGQPGLADPYPNIYAHPEREEIVGNVGGKLGFPTNKSTRPIALSYFQMWAEENPDMIWSALLCTQALSFVRTPQGRAQAAPGAHDDMIAAAWVAYGARAFLMGMWVPVRQFGAMGDDDY